MSVAVLASLALALAACGQGGQDADVLATGPGACCVSTAELHSDVRLYVEDGIFAGRDTVGVPAGERFSIEFTNDDATAHNIAIYRDSSASEPIFVGEPITGPNAEVVYIVPALEEGEYYFRSDHDPSMNGTLRVGRGE